jgi:hypothetical protein
LLSNICHQYNSGIILSPALTLMMQEVQYIKRMCEAAGYQVARAVRAGNRMDLPRDLVCFLPSVNRTSQIGSDPMSISLLLSAEEHLVGLPEAIHLIAYLVGVTALFTVRVTAFLN